MSPSIAYDMLPTRRTTITCLTNAYLVLPDGSLTSHPSSIWVDEVTGKITRIQPYVVDPPSPRCGDDEDDNEDASANVRLIDMNGAIVGPGLIDVQINGAFGVDFSEWNGDDEEYRRKVEQVARGLLQTGVTSFVPTIIVR
jgi:N-acetylglucosamine-6-phosphate deacetylase